MPPKDTPLRTEPKARTLNDVRALARILKQYDLSELQVDVNGARVWLKRTADVPAHTVVTSSPLIQAPAAAAQPEVGTDTAADGPTVSSPFVGTFYRAPSPEADAFVQVGQTVRKGQTLCIVEAMKLMNEIEAESDCKVLEMLVQNGEPVEYGQALFRIEPL